MNPQHLGGRLARTLRHIVFGGVTMATTQQHSKKRDNGALSSRSLAAESAPHRPARPLAGVLPVARIIPQDVHSVGDYVSGAMGVLSMFLADELSAKLAGSAIGSNIIGVSLMTDYRLSAAKLIPIEVHEMLDYASAAMYIAAPFALGYWKKDPLVSALHIGTGALIIATSLLTDYRADKGVGARVGEMLEGG
jgi:hypothetical protein